MKKSIYIILILFAYVSCKTDNLPEDFELEGNWSVLYSDKFDERYIYQEIYFSKDTMNVFDYMNGIGLPSHYIIENDSIYISNIGSDTTISAKIIYKKPDYIIFENDSMDLKLTRINDEGWSVDSLLKTGIFYGRNKDSLRDAVLQDFINYQFRIREIKSWIFHGLDTKKSLIKYWKSQVGKFEELDDYYIYLINYFEEN
ncbi:MAG: hypothetical protein K8R54_07065 [Bacteroidales bacterium]|nr:hypothetical protein [Bacteroidales bacterium]